MLRREFCRNNISWLDHAYLSCVWKKQRKLIPGEYHIEARIPQTRGGILNCYCIVFYTVPYGDCSEWLESHLELI